MDLELTLFIDLETSMTAYERRQSILEVLRRKPGLRVSELAETFDVSEGTIRNDLDAAV